MTRCYSGAATGSSLVKAVTVRFPEGASDASARAFLARLRLGVPAGTACLRAEREAT